MKLLSLFVYIYGVKTFLRHTEKTCGLSSWVKNYQRRHTHSSKKLAFENDFNQFISQIQGNNREKKRILLIHKLRVENVGENFIWPLFSGCSSTLLL